MFSILSISLAAAVLSTAQPPMDFNFRQADGKKSIKDLSGKYEMRSLNHTFYAPKGNLRSDIGADFAVNMPQKEFKQGMTLRCTFAWAPVLLAQGRIPLVAKGRPWRHNDFYFGLVNGMPVFYFDIGRNRNQGIYAVGYEYGKTWRFSDPSIKVYAPELVKIPPHRKVDIFVTYDNRKISIYRSGKLVMTKQFSKPSPLKLRPEHPLTVGCDRTSTGEHHANANALFYRTSLYSHVLSAQEIAKLSVKEASNILPICRHYYHGRLKGFDYDLENRLPETAAFYAKKRPAAEKIREAKVISQAGRYFPSVNGKAFYPIAGYPGLGWYGEQAVRQSAEFVRDFAASGIDLNYAGSGNVSLTWIGKDKYDWKKLDYGLKEIVSANPGIRLLWAVPCYVPQWFAKAYPEELEKYHSSRSSKSPLLTWTHSLLGSEKFDAELKKFIKAYVSHIENSPYAGNVAGYLFTGGDAGEFYWPASFTGGVGGYSENTRKSFSKWLKGKYKTDKTLAAAWGRPGVTFKSVKAPTPEERFNFSREIFLDPVKERNLSDFRDFQTDLTGKTVSMIAKTIKESSNKRKMVAMYGGYPILFAGKRQTHPSTRITSKIFRNPDIDIVMTPIDYQKRRGGEPGANINPYSGSATLHGKILVNESDLRTHFYSVNSPHRSGSEEESINVIKRCFGMSLTTRGGLEYMAMAGNCSYHSSGMMKALAECAFVGRDSLKRNNKSCAEVAYFFDEQVLTHTRNGREDFFDWMCWGVYENAFKAGAPFDFYLLQDLADKRLPDYKLYIFINAFKLSPEIRKAIETKIRKRGAAALWLYAPGGMNGLKVMKEVTGMNITKVKVNKNIKYKPVQNKIFNLPLSTCRSTPVGTGFFVNDPKAVTVALADGKPALAVKNKQIFSLLVPDPSMLREVYRYAKVHVYTPRNDIFSATGDYIMLHTTSAADKHLHFPKPVTVFDAFTGKLLHKKTNSMIFPKQKSGKTILLRIEK